MTNATSSYGTTNTFLTANSETTTLFNQPQPIFTLNTTVTLAGGCGSACWTSSSFQLQSGAILQVTAPTCEYCLVAIDNTNGSYNAAILVLPPPTSGIGTYMATAAVADSGSYEVVLGNLGSYPIAVSSLSIAQMVSSLQTSLRTSELIRAGTVLVTFNSTAYSTSYSTTYLASMNSPYAVLGWEPSAAIIGVIAIIALFAILLDPGENE